MYMIHTVDELKLKVTINLTRIFLFIDDIHSAHFKVRPFTFMDHVEMRCILAHNRIMNELQLCISMTYVATRQVKECRNSKGCKFIDKPIRDRTIIEQK